MPRKPNVRLDSADVQGEGSYVTFRHLLWGEFQELSKQLDAKEITEHQHSNQILGRQVAAWNWTDDSDQPLTLPRDDPSVLERLTDEEMGWLVEQVSANRREQAEASKSG